MAFTLDWDDEDVQEAPKGGGASYRWLEEGDEVPRAGAYPAEILFADEGESRAGDPMLTLTFGVTTPAGAYKARDYVLLTKKFAWKLKAYADALGLKRGAKVYADDLKGARVLGRLKVEQYQGRPSLKIDGVAPDPQQDAVAAPIADDDDVPF